MSQTLKLERLEPETVVEFTPAPCYTSDGKRKAEPKIQRTVFPEVYMLISGEKTLNLVQLWSTNYFHWLYDTFGDWVWFRSVFGEQIKEWTCWVEKARPPFFCQALYLVGNYKVQPYKFNTPGADTFLFQTNTVLNQKRRTGAVHPTVLSFIRSLGQAFVGSRSILIQRNKLGGDPNQSRNFVNRIDLINALIKAGISIEVVYLEGINVENQIKIFASAKLIIAAHGAGLSNLAFCKPGTRVIEVTHPNFDNALYRNWQLGLDHYAIDGVGVPKVPNLPDMQQPMAVNVEAIVRLATKQ